MNSGECCALNDGQRRPTMANGGQHWVSVEGAAFATHHRMGAGACECGAPTMSMICADLPCGPATANDYQWCRGAAFAHHDPNAIMDSGECCAPMMITDMSRRSTMASVGYHWSAL